MENWDHFCNQPRAGGGHRRQGLWTVKGILFLFCGYCSKIFKVDFAFAKTILALDKMSRHGGSEEAVVEVQVRDD